MWTRSTLAIHNYQQSVDRRYKLQFSTPFLSLRPIAAWRSEFTHQLAIKQVFTRNDHISYLYEFFNNANFNQPFLGVVYALQNSHIFTKIPENYENWFCSIQSFCCFYKVVYSLKPPVNCLKIHIFYPTFLTSNRKRQYNRKSFFYRTNDNFSSFNWHRNESVTLFCKSAAVNYFKFG